jgi:sugar transferase (PEP-CTERM system associated)
VLIKLKVKLLILIAGDALLAVASYWLGFLLRFGSNRAVHEFELKSPLTFILFVLMLVGTSYVFELYNLGAHRRYRYFFLKIIFSALMTFVLLSCLFFLLPPLKIGRGLLILSLILFIFIQFVWHNIFIRLFNLPALAERIVIVGTHGIALQLGDLIQDSSIKFNHILFGYLSLITEHDPPKVPVDKIVGSSADLLSIVLQEKIAKIILTSAEHGVIAPLRGTLLNCRFHGVDVIDAPTFYEILTGKFMLENLNIDRLIFSNGFRRSTFMNSVKRLSDIVIAIVGLLVALPCFPLIALLVKINAPGPVFFSQTRVGQWEKCFVLYKFRTMRQNAESETGAVWTTAHDPRLGIIGRFLRKWRIDEIPQLFNVLKGDMSIIGPRPERPEFVTKLEKIIPFYPKRHFIKPGITGWAQVKYAYGASFADSYEKLCYDLYYLKNMSPLLDLVIIMQTARVLLFGRGGR